MRKSYLRLASLVLASLFFFGLCSCQGEKNVGENNAAEMYVVSGAYNLTPQEYIDRVNELVESTGDSQYKTIPDFEESGSPIYVSLPITVIIYTNDDGFITCVKYNWTIKNQSAQNAATFLVGATMCLLSPDNVDDIVAQLGLTAAVNSYIETNYTIDGSTYDYFAYGDGKYNILTIAPAAPE